MLFNQSARISLGLFWLASASPGESSFWSCSWSWKWIQERDNGLFNGYAQKSLFVYGGQTSVATKRLNEQTQILFLKSVIQDMKDRYGVIRACSPEMIHPSVSVSSERETSIATVKGVAADYFQIRILEVKEGRPLNPLDDHLSRNVAVIGEGVNQALFGKSSGLGKRIIIGEAIFRGCGHPFFEDLFSLQEGEWFTCHRHLSALNSIRKGLLPLSAFLCHQMPKLLI
jgi:hypothetical protein